MHGFSQGQLEVIRDYIATSGNKTTDQLLKEVRKALGEGKKKLTVSIPIKTVNRLNDYCKEKKRFQSEVVDEMITTYLKVEGRYYNAK